jgi:hypothetical protein
MTFRKTEYTENWEKRNWIAFCGELVLEGSVDVS